MSRPPRSRQSRGRRRRGAFPRRPRRSRNENSGPPCLAQWLVGKLARVTSSTSRATAQRTAGASSRATSHRTTLALRYRILRPIFVIGGPLLSPRQRSSVFTQTSISRANSAAVKYSSSSQCLSPTAQSPCDGTPAGIEGDSSAPTIEEIT